MLNLTSAFANRRSVSKIKSVLFGGEACKVACQFNRKEPMTERKNVKKARNYLVTSQCPKCEKNSEHSFSRVQKGSTLICPHCNQLFQPSKNVAA